MSETTFEELLRSPQFRQALFDLETAECARYAQDTRPATFSPKFERRMKRLIKARGNKISFIVYTICRESLCFLRRHL